MNAACLMHAGGRNGKLAWAPVWLAAVVRLGGLLALHQRYPPYAWRLEFAEASFRGSIVAAATDDCSAIGAGAIWRVVLRALGSASARRARLGSDSISSIIGRRNVSMTCGGRRRQASEAESAQSVSAS